MATEQYTYATSRDSFHEEMMYRELANSYGESTANIKPAGAEQIVAQTRNPVITPQCLVNLAVTVRKGECELRKKATEHDDGELIADHASDDAVHRMNKGQVVMMRYGGDGFNTNMNADSQMDAVVALNGTSSNDKWCLPAVVQTMSDPSNLMDNQAQATVTVHGPQTIVNYGTDRINTGDAVYLTPYAPLVKLGKDGKHGPRMGPLIRGPPGYHADAVQWGVMPMRGNTVATFIKRAKEKFRVRIGSTDFIKRAVNNSITVLGLYGLLTSELDNMFSSDFTVAVDHPIRGYMLIWAAKRWSNFLKLERPGGATANLGMHLRIALMVRHRVMRETEELYAKRGDEYGAPLPHDGDHEDAFNTSIKRSYSTLNGEYLKQLIGIGSSPSKVTREGMMEGETRISMHEDEMLEEFWSRIKAFFDTFRLGVALQSVDKGMAFDIFVGK